LYPFPLSWPLEDNLSIEARGPFTPFETKGAFTCYWLWHHNNWYPVAFEHRQWHYVHVTSLRTHNQWLAYGSAHGTPGVPTRERLQELYEAGLLYDEPTPPTTEQNTLALEADALATALSPIASLQGSLPLTAQPTVPVILQQTIASTTINPQNPTVTAPTMSASATGTGSGTRAPTGGNPPPASGALRGTTPAIFNGNQTDSKTFLSQFRRFKMLNKDNDIMKTPFYCVLTALSYIRGENVNNWVESQDLGLETKTTRATNPLRYDDEALWTEFVTNFKTTWSDTAAKETADNQLQKLRMKDREIDTYIATFERLIKAAGWDDASGGTIRQFKHGLTQEVYKHILYCETMPTTMVEWKESAKKEVIRLHAIDNAHFNNWHANFNPYPTTQPQRPKPQNSGVVPMDVDTTTIQKPHFVKLTDDERTKLAAEGRCFRCRTQGHLARDCPKGRTPTIRTTDDTPETPDTPVQQPVPTKTQQITAIIASMDEDERGTYLDSCDMDFANAEL
jgi:hypothetical protein